MRVCCRLFLDILIFRILLYIPYNIICSLLFFDAIAFDTMKSLLCESLRYSIPIGLTIPLFCLIVAQCLIQVLIRHDFLCSHARYHLRQRALLPVVFALATSPAQARALFDRLELRSLGVWQWLPPIYQLCHCRLPTQCTFSVGFDRCRIVRIIGIDCHAFRATMILGRDNCSSAL